jgi:hypothetical protein
VGAGSRADEGPDVKRVAGRGLMRRRRREGAVTAAGGKQYALVH